MPLPANYSRPGHSMMLLLPSREAGHKCQIANMKQNVYLSICCSKLLCGLQSSSFPCFSILARLLRCCSVICSWAASNCSYTWRPNVCLLQKLCLLFDGMAQHVQLKTVTMCLQPKMADSGAMALTCKCSGLLQVANLCGCATQEGVMNSLLLHLLRICQAALIFEVQPQSIHLVTKPQHLSLQLCSIADSCG